MLRDIVLEYLVISSLLIYYQASPSLNEPGWQCSFTWPHSSLTYFNLRLTKSQVADMECYWILQTASVRHKTDSCILDESLWLYVKQWKSPIRCHRKVMFVNVLGWFCPKIIMCGFLTLADNSWVLSFACLIKVGGKIAHVILDNSMAVKALRGKTTH